MRVAKAALALVLLLCIAMTVHQVHRPNLADFQVYDTAAELVLHGQSRHIYDDADTGIDPQLRFSAPDTAYAQMAQRHGIDRIRLYVYPPILADLLVPLAFFPAGAAAKLWLVLNLAALLVVVWLMAGIVGAPVAGRGGAMLAIGLLSLFATGMCLIWGQITIMLLLLWTAGLYAYARGFKGVSAFMLALATAIKLTPLLVVVPFLVWRDWKWLGAYTLSVLSMIVAMLAANGSALLDYVRHVMPSMSGGVPNLENKSLVSSVELIYVALHGGAVKHETLLVPPNVLLLAKLLSLLAAAAVLLLLVRAGRALPLRGRTLTIALIALVSTCVSPVSWKHAYVVEFLPLALLWAEALRSRLSAAELTLLTVCSIGLGSLFVDSVAGKLLHGLPLAVESLFTPGCGVILAIYFLAKRRPLAAQPALS